MLALWCVSSTSGAWAQSISVPLGTAAGFGLLSGGTLSTDSTGVYVIGKAGAAGTTSGTITATGGLLRASVPAMAPTITLALQDLAAARAYCTALPAQPLSAPLAGQTLQPGAYTIAGGAMLGVRQTLTLTGDTSARYVFNITGGLHLDSGAFVLSGQVTARQIYWNVTGAVTLAPEVLLPGIVLGNDVITKTGDQFGTVALLTTGNALSIVGLDPVAGNNQFAAPTSQPPACLTPPLPTGPNIAPNFSFEDACRCPTGISNMPVSNSDVLSWYTAIETTPDYFRSCPNSGNDPLSNVMGHQPPRNGGLGMVGVIANREYVQVGLLPLPPNRPYYAECFWSLAESSQSATSVLGLYLGSRRGDPVNSPRDLVYRENGQLVVPQVESPVTVPLLNTDDAIWTPVGGFLTTPAANQPAWRYLTLGVFRIPDPNPGPNRNRFPSNIPGARNTRPYYYLDDVTLWALPLAPLPVTVECAGTPFVLGWATPPALPTTLTGRVTYEWTGPGIGGTITGTQFTMTLPNYGTYDYTLKVIIDQGGANPHIYTYPQSIRVTVQPPVVSILDDNNQSIDGNTLTLAPTDPTIPLQGTPAGGTWTDPAGVLSCTNCATAILDPAQLLPGASVVLTYSYTNPVTGCTASAWVQVQMAPAVLDCPLQDCWQVVEVPDPASTPPGPGGWVYTQNPFVEAAVCYHITESIRLENGDFFLPPGCRLLFDKDVSITLGDRAVFAANGATLTAACEEMWGGILLEDFKGTGLNLEYCTFSHSQLGVVTAGNQPGLNITDCTFLNNRVDVELAPLVASASPLYNVVIQDNLFSVAGPFKRPLTSLTSRSDVHLNLSNNEVARNAIAHNTFEHALIGVYGGIRQAYMPSGPTNVPTRVMLTKNTFTDCLMGGVVGATRWEGLLTQSQFAISSATWAPSAYRTAFAADYQLPAVLTGRPVGAYLPGAVNVIGNEFTYPDAPTDFGPLTAALARPVGLWLPHTGNSPTGIASTVTRNTFGNLETAILTHPANHQVVDNTLSNCRYGLRIQLPTGRWTGNFEPPLGLYVSCNTFWRTVPLGQSADVALDQNVRVFFAHRDPQSGVLIPGTSTPPTPGDGMKNLFVNTGSAGNGGANAGWNLYNDPNNEAVVYKTFAPVSPGVPASNTSNILTAGSVALTSGIGIGAQMPTFTIQQSCAVEDGYNNGIQARLVQGITGMAPTPAAALAVWPNPGDAVVNLTLALPPGMINGEIVLRDAVLGRIVQRYPVRAGQTEMQVATRSLPEGLYLCSLVVDAQNVSSVRLQVVH